MSDTTYDLTVIGTGPGGYVCAIRAAQLGMKVAVVEKRKSHGGTCLNVGCIPSKALLHASELFDEANNGMEKLGIKVSPELDLKAMMKHKIDTVNGNTSGIEFLFKKNKIKTFHGTGKITAAGKVTVTDEKGNEETINSKSIAIATGSDVANIPGVETDEKMVLSSTGALDLEKVPEKMLVVGAGVIGLELGSVWRRLGTEVTVVEYLDRILPGMDNEIAKNFQRILKKQGIEFKLGTKVTGVEKDGKGAAVTIEPSDGGKSETIKTDVVLAAIGRIPFTEGLGLEDLGVAKDNRGRITVDKNFKTSVDGIYAIGDVIEGPMLAHKAEEEGVALAEMLAGDAGHVNYNVIPSVVYTYPEVASVGKTEEQLKEEGTEFKIGKFPFTANGRAKANRQTDGFVKVLADKTTDRVLGVHIVGPMAGEMIGEAAVLMEFGGSAEDLARTCHAHPTLTEAIKEAALDTDKRAIHM